MSWNFKKVGLVAMPAELKAAVQAEHAPQVIKDEVCHRIDGLASVESYQGQAIVVDTRGHIENDVLRPFNGVHDLLIFVYAAPLINTPLA